MKLVKYIIPFVLLALPLTGTSQNIKTGLEVLKASNFKVLEGKRVGLITNLPDSTIILSQQLMFFTKQRMLNWLLYLALNMV